MGPVARHGDPAGFLAEVGPRLEEAEARNNLILGLAGTLADHPGTYEAFRLWSVGEGGRPLGAALMTSPPDKPVLADAASPAVVAALASAIAEDLGTIGAAIGNRPTIDWFVDAWCAQTGAQAVPIGSQGVFSLDAVQDVPRPYGRSRVAVTTDEDLLVSWLAAFLAESLPEDDADMAWWRRLVASRLAGGPSLGFMVWEVAGRVVSMSSHGAPTRHGTRISFVYTPPQHRGLGYATALVADQSSMLLSSGYRFCFLNTDLANPTSNAIYRRIGYRQVAESADYHFRVNHTAGFAPGQPSSTEGGCEPAGASM